MFPKGAQVLVTSALSAPGEGRSRVGRKNLPRIRSSEITSTLCTPYVYCKPLFAHGHYALFRLKIHLSGCGPRGTGPRDISLRSNCGASATIGRRGPANL